VQPIARRNATATAETAESALEDLDRSLHRLVANDPRRNE